MKLKGIGVNMERMTQIQIFKLAEQSEEGVNTFLYEIQKYTSAQIVSTSISDGVILVEYTIPAEYVKEIEESK